jgi:acetyl-CoA carboxylase biotin carboxyl carrier protein
LSSPSAPDPSSTQRPHGLARKTLGHRNELAEAAASIVRLQARRVAEPAEARRTAVAPARARPLGRPEVMQVLAEMVANVWKVLVSPGHSVAVGEHLVILESMKMEIPVDSPAAGTVTDVRVQESGVVQEGDVIAVVE